jgi:hypothetical protein
MTTLPQSICKGVHAFFAGDWVQTGGLEVQEPPLGYQRNLIRVRLPALSGIAMCSSSSPVCLP